MYNVFSVVNTQDSTTITALKNHGRSIIWDVTLTFNEPGGGYDYTVFGEAPDAHDGPPADSYDVTKPPAPIPPYVRAWFDDNLPAPYNKLWKDYRHYPGTMKVWNLSVQWVPSDGDYPTTVTISWDPTLFDDSEYTVVTLCTNLGVPLKDMLLYNTYIFTCPADTPQSFKIICLVNHPPAFGTPIPANGSTGNPLSFTWSIPINDPEGNTFSWTIQCNNGQTNSGSGAANGTKTLALSGLAYSTTYKVWVNATDPTGSGLWTRRWFTFTTKGSTPPVFGTPSPVNGSTGNQLSFTWSIPINDPEGDLFSWTIQCNNGQANSGTSASNGTKTLALSGLAYSTSYKVWVNATDPTGSGLYTRRWYSFTTKANLPPVFGTPSPANSSTNNPLSLTWSIPINDPEGNTFSWTIQCNNGQINSGSGAANGTKTLALSGLAYSTTYKVWVNATDPTGSGLYTRRWYTFTTKASQPPVFGSPNPANGSTNNPLSLTWSIPINDPEGDLFSWTIQCNNGQANSGTSASNGTKTLALTGLAYSTSYKVWVNATDPGGSGMYTRKWYTFTTKANQPPYVPSNSSPPNGATNVSIPLELFWTGGDPDPGDTVTYDVYFGTISPPVIMVHNLSATSYNPGTLLYQKTYYWRIVAWDSHNASTAGPIWNFTTEQQPDTTPPQVEITTPQKGYLYINLADFVIMKIPFFTTLIIGKITVTVNAIDNQSGINRVEFYVDTELKANDTTAPYEWTWTERGHFFPYLLKAIAYDNAGHHNSAEVKVWKIF